MGPAPRPQPNVDHGSTPGNRLNNTNVANLWVNQRSQINEDTIEPSLAAQDINPITYVPDPIFVPPIGFVPGYVQLIRSQRVLSIA